MNRRQYLVAIAGLTSASFAGCTAVADETQLDAPTEQHDDQSVYYRYEHDDEELLRVSFNIQDEATAVTRLRAYVEQPADTTLDTYRFRFTPDTTDETSTAIYVQPPRLGHADDFDTYRDTDWAVVEGEYDDARRVTTGIEVLVYGDGHSDASLPPLLVDYAVTLTRDGVFGDTVVATDQVTVDLSIRE